MNSTRIQLFLFLLMTLFFTTLSSAQAAPANSKLFREYIGAEDKGVRFSDVPIDSRVEFHFILSFAIDYTTSSHPNRTNGNFNFTTSSHPKPTNGNFNVFWDTKNLSPSHVSAIKASHPNAKVALSLGGDTVKGNQYAYFSPTSINSWVRNAIASIVQITKEYELISTMNTSRQIPIHLLNALGDYYSTLNKIMLCPSHQLHHMKMIPCNHITWHCGGSMGTSLTMLTFSFMPIVRAQQ